MPSGQPSRSTVQPLDEEEGVTDAESEWAECIQKNKPWFIGPCWILLFFLGGTGIVSTIVSMTFIMHSIRRSNKGPPFVDNAIANKTNATTTTTDDLYPPTDPDRLSKLQVALGVFPDTDSPQEEALQWLAYDDTVYDVVYDDFGDIPREDLMQRYALVVFHIATGRWNRMGGWATESGAYQHECLWPGVRCDRDDIRVKSLDFKKQEVGKLTGTIPTEIGLLKNLSKMTCRRVYA